MPNKSKHTEAEIAHKEIVLKYTNRAAEESKRYESLMMLFVDQAERIENEIEQLKRKLPSAQTSSANSSKTKRKNEKNKKK
jgi:Skp family chaperone for outer membrane proteins